MAAARESASAVELPSDPQRMAASGAGRDDAGRAGVVEDGADPVAVSAEQPGQDESELGQHVLLSAARAADHHGRRSVEDQPGGQLAVLVELAYLRFVEPGGDVPVDVPGVVAFVVRPHSGEVKTTPRRGVRYPPWTRPSSRRTTRHSSRCSRRSGAVIMAGGQGCRPHLPEAIMAAAPRPASDGAQDAREDGVGVEVVGQRLVRQHDAVAQHVERHLVDVVGQHVVPAAQERQRPAAQDERDRGPRARPVGHVPLQVALADPARRPGGRDEPYGVVDDRGVDVDLLDARPHPDQVRRGQHHLRRTGRDAAPARRSRAPPASSGNPRATFIMNRSTCASGSG